MKQEVLELFAKQNPLSVNGKSIYRQDYESILDYNWLRTEVIGSLITIFEKKFASKIEELVHNEFKKESLTDFSNTEKDLKERLSKYVKIIDPFIVTMILNTQEDFILQTLEGLEIFNKHSKYIVFPMNTEFCKGDHWFLTVVKNPRFQDFISKKEDSNEELIEIYILNSIPSSKNDPSVYMANELSQQSIKLLKLFHPNEKLPIKSSFHRLEKISQQSNSYDCGVFTIAFIEELLFNYILQNELERLVKLKLWNQPSEKNQSSQLCSELSKESEFLILKPSTFLRKYYRELLEREILDENSVLIEGKP